MLIFTVMEGNIETEELPEEFEICETSTDDNEHSLRQGNEWPYDYDDSFNFEVSVAITEAETDEMTSEFSDALKEIDGAKSFPCSLCNNVCKSKGGLTQHTNSKHSEGSSGSHPSDANLCKDDVDSFVKAIKGTIFEEKLYGSEIISALDTVSFTEPLFPALLPIYQTFCRKNEDKLLELFYGLIPHSCELLCELKISGELLCELPCELKITE
jgi:hypothetical protein